MNRFNFTDEEINKILLSSPMVLPSNPTELGLKGNNVKLFFYDFIRRLMLLINEHFVLIERDKEQSIDEHNGEGTSHSDLRGLIENLDVRATELGDAISEHYNDVSGKLENERQKVQAALSDHNNDKNAHVQIRWDISEARSIAQNALDFAQGKSKIIPVKDVFEMTTKLNNNLNVGDKFVLSDKSVPDFTLFEKESNNESATSFTQVDILLGNVEFLPGESYLYNGFLLVASESGIDTSLFARQDAIIELNNLITDTEADLRSVMQEIIAELSLKEHSLNSVTETSQTVTLQNKTEHSAGLRTVLSLQLGETVSDDFECIVNFRSGLNPTSFSCDERIILTQDDCYQGVLSPMPNRIYEINLKNVGGVIIGRVGACDYGAV